MKVRAFAVFDVKAQVYMPPFFFAERGQGHRQFFDIVQNKDHPIGLHPEDYSLFEVGQYDDATGLLEPYKGPELVCTALQCVKE